MSVSTQQDQLVYARSRGSKRHARMLALHTPRGGRGKSCKTASVRGCTAKQQVSEDARQNSKCPRMHAGARRSQTYKKRRQHIIADAHRHGRCATSQLSTLGRIETHQRGDVASTLPIHVHTGPPAESAATHSSLGARRSALGARRSARVDMDDERGNPCLG